VSRPLAFTKMSGAGNDFIVLTEAAWESIPGDRAAWIVCYAPIVGVRGFGWVVVAFAFLVDIASYTSGRRAQRDRATRTV